ncbi:glutamine amidotransferase [Corynebacterium occultum]|uniref:Glutamine amidotransferase n=1 Tax=Corynebacterium occultum TaxID=2675219 RepID=A0A6B8W956_9CORY|nr:glutamine amidotransferase [Corynebacterium occultum]QGU07446.1 glutamine amidotransferase [Corynebacterium occultum]
MLSVLLVSPRQGAAVAAAEYRDVLKATGLEPEELTQRMLDSEDAVIGDLSEFDGVIVGGSSLNVTDFEYGPWQRQVHEELTRLSEASIPTLMVCYGASFLTYAGGGRVGRSHPESSGPTIVELTEAGRRDPLSANLPERFTSLTGHTENIERPGRGAVVLATGPSCPVQMIRTNEWTWACQFHADMDAAAMKDRMDFYFDYGYFSPEDYAAIVAHLPSVDTTWSRQVLRNFVTYCAEHNSATLQPQLEKAPVG